MSRVTIFRTFDSVEANLVSTRLQTAGIPAEIVNEVSGMLFHATGGMRVEVPEESADEARALINSEPGPGENSQGDSQQP